MATRIRKRRAGDGAASTSASRPSARLTAAEALCDDVLNRKRDRILKEAASLFYGQGYIQTTVDAIAERFGATKPFVYYHFKSKIDLLVEICEQGAGDALTAIE